MAKKMLRQKLETREREDDDSEYEGGKKIDSEINQFYCSTERYKQTVKLS